MSGQRIKSHDHFIAKAMARDSISKEILDSYLPDEVKKLIDLKTLQQFNTKLLSNILGEGIVDKIFSLEF